VAEVQGVPKQRAIAPYYMQHHVSFALPAHLNITSRAVLGHVLGTGSVPLRCSVHRRSIPGTAHCTSTILFWHCPGTRAPRFLP
jgi:hypothetical protein